MVTELKIEREGRKRHSRKNFLVVEKKILRQERKKAREKERKKERRKERKSEEKLREK